MGSYASGRRVRRRRTIAGLSGGEGPLPPARGTGWDDTERRACGGEWIEEEKNQLGGKMKIKTDLKMKSEDFLAMTIAIELFYRI